MYAPSRRYSERAARALVQVLTCLAHWDARPTGGGADVGDRRVHGVLSEVVGLPGCDLIKSGEPVNQGMMGSHGALRSRPLPAGHSTMVDQTISMQAAFATAHPGTKAMRRGETRPLGSPPIKPALSIRGPGRTSNALYQIICT